MRTLLFGCAVACTLLCDAPARASEWAGLEALLARYSREATPGPAVLVLRDGEVAFQAAHGYRSLGARARNTIHTRFDLASLGKQLTAAAVLLLERDGKLRLDDRVARHLPELRRVGAGVTLRHLLTHTAGLPDYFALCTDGGQRTNADVVAFVAGLKRLESPPGRRHHYSNTGYALLASVVERVARRPFADFLAERIFAPLGMKESFVNRDAAPVGEELAEGYLGWPTYRPALDAETRACNTIAGDGAVFSTLGDLALWYRALDEASLLPREALARMFEPARLSDGTRIDYGLGWELTTIDGQELAYHRGEWGGFSNLVVRVPGQKVAIVLLSNYGPLDPREILGEIARSDPRLGCLSRLRFDP